MHEYADKWIIRHEIRKEKHAKEHGAKIVEGYPIEPKQTNLQGYSGFTGLISAFQEAGFVEVLRRSENRPIMRYFVEEHNER
jgi:hypothetical protein